MRCFPLNVNCLEIELMKSRTAMASALMTRRTFFEREGDGIFERPPDAVHPFPFPAGMARRLAAQDASVVVLFLGGLTVARRCDTLPPLFQLHK